MFEKVVKGAKKAVAKMMKEGKSEAQIAYEKMRDSNKERALDLCNAQQQELAKLGWRLFPVISHPRADRPDIVSSSLILTEVPYAHFEQKSAQKPEAAPEVTEEKPTTAPVAEGEESKPTE